MNILIVNAFCLHIKCDSWGWTWQFYWLMTFSIDCLLSYRCCCSKVRHCRLCVCQSSISSSEFINPHNPSTVCIVCVFFFFRYLRNWEDTDANVQFFFFRKRFSFNSFQSNANKRKRNIQKMKHVQTYTRTIANNVKIKFDEAKCMTFWLNKKKTLRNEAYKIDWVDKWIWIFNVCIKKNIYCIFRYKWAQWWFRRVFDFYLYHFQSH